MAQEVADIEPNEDGEADEIEELQPKRLSGKKIVAFAGAALLLLALIGGGLWFTGSDGSDAPAEEAGKAAKAQPVFIDLPELVVNLNTGERQPRYLRARISLEVSGPAAKTEVEEKLPRVIDDFQVYLRELRAQDLNGSAGLYRLKEELLKRINTSVAPAEVKDVLFREMIVQ